MTYQTSRAGTLRAVAAAGLLIVFLVGFAVLIVALTISPNHGQNSASIALLLAAIFGLFAAFLGFAALRSLRRLRSHEPALVLSESGLIYPPYSTDVVPWRAISFMEPIFNGRSSGLRIEVDPAVGAKLKVRSPGLRIDPCAFGLSVGTIDGPPDLIINQCVQAREAAKSGARMPRFGVQDADTALPAIATPQAHPLFTYALLAALVAIFACERAVDYNSGPFANVGRVTLDVLGGVNKAQIFQDGQIWRLCAGALLHANILHLLLNCGVLWFASGTLEKLIGWRWTSALFAFAAVCGSIVSALAHPITTVSVGASGAIMGELGALIVLAGRIRAQTESVRVANLAWRLVVPSLLPSSGHLGNLVVDYAGHVGGLIGGTLFALALSRRWPQADVRPKGAVAPLTMFAAFTIAGIAPIVFTLV